MSEENVVYIGRKPVMNYCLAVLSSLQNDGGTVTLKARGHAISTAVNVVEVTRAQDDKGSVGSHMCYHPQPL